MSQVINKYNVPALFYDESCPLCLRFKQSLERLDVYSDLHFYPIQDSRLEHHFNKLNQQFTQSKLSDQVHLMTDNYELMRGSEVIEYLAKKSPLIHKFSWLIESKMGKKALKIFYDTSNRYRETLRKRCHQCND